MKPPPLYFGGACNSYAADQEPVPSRNSKVIITHFRRLEKGAGRKFHAKRMDVYFPAVFLTNLKAMKTAIFPQFRDT